MAESRPSPQEPPFRIWIRRIEPPAGPFAIRYEMSEGKGILRQSRPGVVLDPPARPQGIETGLSASQIRSARFLHVWGKGAFRQGYIFGRVTDPELGRLPEDEWVEMVVVHEGSQAWLTIPAVLPPRPRPMIRREGADLPTVVPPNAPMSVSVLTQGPSSRVQRRMRRGAGDGPTLPDASPTDALTDPQTDPPFDVGTHRLGVRAAHGSPPGSQVSDTTETWRHGTFRGDAHGDPHGDHHDDGGEDVVPVGEAEDDEDHGDILHLGHADDMPTGEPVLPFTRGGFEGVAGLEEQNEATRSERAERDVGDDGEAFVFDEMESTPEPVPMGAPRPEASRGGSYGGVTDPRLDFGDMDVDDAPDESIAIMENLERELRLARERIRMLEAENAALRARLEPQIEG